MGSDGTPMIYTVDIGLHWVDIIECKSIPMSDVLWDVALDSEGNRVWINEHAGQSVYCPECESEMIPIRGTIVQHHYRHKADSDCSGESAKHWSKKYEIADALSHFGEVKVEGKIGDYIADVLYEDKWAFEVVYSNPPSAEKMDDLRDSLIIFNFNDSTVWGDSENELHPTTMFWHIKPKPKSFIHVVQSFARDLSAGKELDVCGICREVKGVASRLKEGGICVMCDIGWSKESERIEQLAKAYRDAKKR